MIKPYLAGALALAASPAFAADLLLAKTGGGMTQTTTMKLTGDPGKNYLLLFATSEASTPINAFLTLDIPLTLLPIAIQVPGFLGTLNGSGQANVSFVLPSDPVLDSLTLSFQALGANAALNQVSNMVRLTPAAPGAFENTLGSAALPVSGGAVVEKSDGEVLLVGGSGPVFQSYDSNREEFELGGPAFGVGLFGQSTALADGRILFTGGLGLDGQPTDAAAIFDPATFQTTTLTMTAKRAGHGASLLNDGRVLITGGFAAFSLTDLLTLLQGIQGTTELFDPNTGAFTTGPTLLEPRALHTSTTLTNGRVLIAGGMTIIPIINVPTVSNTAYAYNPSSGQFGLPAFMNGARMLHTAAPLTNGKVLLAGGLSVDFSQVIATGDLTQLVVGTLSDCQLFTTGFLGLGTFQTITGMSSPRAGAGVAQLPNGEAVIVGGIDLSLSTTGITAATLATSDRYSASGIVPTGSLLGARFLPVLEPLNDGTVLVVGGGPLEAEVYQP
jgi:hypothetical protein